MELHDGVLLGLLFKPSISLKLQVGLLSNTEDGENEFFRNVG
jgi:hypothetical protein